LPFSANFERDVLTAEARLKQGRMSVKSEACDWQVTECPLTVKAKRQTFEAIKRESWLYTHFMLDRKKCLASNEIEIVENNATINVKYFFSRAFNAKEGVWDYQQPGEVLALVLEATTVFN
jgi:hypothetical protein